MVLSGNGCERVDFKREGMTVAGKDDQGRE